jgi:hypothetical protein
MLTVSPVLHIAVFTSQPSSRDQFACLGSRVSGSNASQAGRSAESLSQTSGKRLLSLMVAKAGFATGVFPPRKSSLQPTDSGQREIHSAW